MKKYNPSVEETWRAYDVVLKAVADEAVDATTVAQARRILDDLRLTESAGNAGCMLPRMAQLLFGVLLSVGTMALGMVVCFYLPLEWAVDILGATAPWWSIEAVLMAIFVAVLAIIFTTVTIPVARFLLREWIYAKISRLKQATARMPHELMVRHFV